MTRTLTAASIVLMRVLAIAVAIAAARYFLNPIPLLVPTQAAMLVRHPAPVLLHIGCGIAAMAAGLLQFLAPLRASHPAVHRRSGYVYLAAVGIGGVAALRLSPDTAQFAADALNDKTAFEFFGVSPASLGFAANVTYLPSQFVLVVAAFASLAIVWIGTSVAAFVRARQRRFDDHRAWMIRSYSLTFAAVTVRLVAVPLFAVTQNPVVGITLTFWSWIVNLMVAEWLVRRPSRTIGRAWRRSASAA